MADAVRFKNFQQAVGCRAKADQIGLHPHGLGGGGDQGGDRDFAVGQCFDTARVGQYHGAKIGGHHVFRVQVPKPHLQPNQIANHAGAPILTGVDLLGRFKIADDVIGGDRHAPGIQ